MDNKKILLVNLSKGRTGELNSKLLGMIFVMKFQAAAMSRASIPEDQRVDFALYVDEFQNFSTDSFATIMSEARKYHLNLIVANQFTTQLTPEIRDAVFGNMGTIVAFRIGQNDVESLGKYFQPAFDSDDLLRVPNYNTIVRTLVGGVPTQPFSMNTLPPLGNPNQRLSDALKQLSAAKFGRPKSVVEKEIFERMATKETLSPSSPGGAFGAGVGPWQPPVRSQSQPTSAIVSPGTQLSASPQSRPPAKTTSFIDGWMAKKQVTQPQTPNFTPGIKDRRTFSNNEHGPISLNKPLQNEQTILGSRAAPSSKDQNDRSIDRENISSDTLQEKEFAKIAGELEQDLAANSSPPVAGLKPKDQPKITSITNPIKESQRQLEEDQQSQTIYIDQEGNLHHGDLAESEKS
jgi:hypothetical protein